MSSLSDIAELSTELRAKFAALRAFEPMAFAAEDAIRQFSQWWLGRLRLVDRTKQPWLGEAIYVFRWKLERTLVFLRDVTKSWKIRDWRTIRDKCDEVRNLSDHDILHLHDIDRLLMDLEEMLQKEERRKKLKRPRGRPPLGAVLAKPVLRLVFEARKEGKTNREAVQRMHDRLVAVGENPSILDNLMKNPKALPAILKHAFPEEWAAFVEKRKASR
jgi:hypothetical protein